MTTLRVDLHCHSTASDGVLSPLQLMDYYQQAGINMMALTDHDGVDALAQCRQLAQTRQINFVNGIELSVSWQKFTIHIVGLNIDPDYSPLQNGIAQLKAYRLWRAEKIAQALADAGIKDTLAGARAFSAGEMVGRMHFARFLVANGYCKDIRAVFKKFLVNNKPGHIRGEWAKLDEVVDWICGSGGTAVIAHPLRYAFRHKKLLILIDEFKQLGGRAIEVVSGSNQDRGQIDMIAKIAEKTGLLASVGSDFHAPEYAWNQPGKLSPLPDYCNPVWQLWSMV